MSGEFRRLADAHAGAIYTFALYLLRQREDAEDVTQEVLVRLWTHRERIGEGRVRAWAMRVTRNLVVDHARRDRLRVARTTDGPAAERAAARVAGSGAPEESGTSPALRAALESAIAALDEPYRSVLVLREIQELSYDEIAEALAMPLGTVKAYLHRARPRLREDLRREWKHDD